MTLFGRILYSANFVLLYCYCIRSAIGQSCMSLLVYLEKPFADVNQIDRMKCMARYNVCAVDYALL